MDKLDKISDLQKECIRNCVIHRRAMIYKSAHKELTEQEVIKACRNIAGYSDDEAFDLKDYCKAAGVEEKDVINFINDVMQDAKDDDSSITSLSDADWVIGYLNTQKCNSITDLCYIASKQGYDISIQRFKGVQRKHKEWSREEVLGYCILNEKTKQNVIYNVTVNNEIYTLSKLCKLLKLSYDKTRRYVVEDNDIDIYKLSELTDNLYVNILGQLQFTDDFLSEQEEKLNESDSCIKSFRELCRDANINYNSALSFKMRHPDAPDELIVKLYANPDEVTLKELCIMNGVDARQVYKYKNRHPKVSNSKAIKEVKLANERKEQTHEPK